MKSELEEKDIEAIAHRVMELLKPLISVNTLPGEDVLDKPGLAKYLKVSPGTVNKLVSDRAIPFYKLSEGKQSGVRFRKKEIDEWMKKRIYPEFREIEEGTRRKILAGGQVKT